MTDFIIQLDFYEPYV